MKIKLLKCFTCDNWYMPDAHHYHCPTCGTLSVPLKRRRYVWKGNDLMQIVRAIPRINVNRAKERAIAATLYQSHGRPIGRR